MYDVGDVLYIISNKRKNVVPVQVIEQIVRRTAEAEEITFKVALPTQSKSSPEETVVDLHSIQGSVHKTLEEVRIVLYDQASKAINDLLDAAQKVAANKFVTKKEPIPHVDPSESIIHEGPQNYYPTPGQSVPTHQTPLEVDILAGMEPTVYSVEETKMPSVLDFTGAKDATEVKVQMPDGSYAKVKTGL